MGRQEHLQWCKNRALAFVSDGDLQQAFASMVSDCSKHEGTAGHVGIELGAMLLLTGNLSTPEEMKRYIEGFN